MAKSDAPFLKVEGLPDQWQAIARIASAPKEEFTIHTGRWGSQLIFVVEVPGESQRYYRLGIKIGSANLIALEKRLGKDLLTWQNGTFGLHVERFADGAGRARRYLCVDGARQRK